MSSASNRYHGQDEPTLWTELTASDYKFLSKMKIDAKNYFEYGEAKLQENEYWFVSEVAGIAGLLQLCETRERHNERLSCRQYDRMLKILRNNAEGNDRKIIQDEISWLQYGGYPEDLVPATAVMDFAMDLVRR